jgi:hypothetical protein
VTADDEPGRYFPFRYDSRLAPIWLPFRLWPSRQGVTVTEDGRLIAGYGPFRVDVPLSQIQGAHITGGGPPLGRGCRWLTTDSRSAPTQLKVCASTSRRAFAG